MTDRLSIAAQRRVLATAVVAFVFSGSASQAWAKNQDPVKSRPNVVLIMTDDQGYGDFGATGNPLIDTPNIDALARRGGMLSTFYVSPVCSPTRACLMTGRYNYRTRVIDTYLGRSMMEPAEVTIAELLGGAGYATGIFGKWHLGDCYPMRPQDQGFQQSLIHRGGGLAQPSEPRENKRRYTDPILFENGKQVRTTGYCTDIYFDAAGKFIEKALKEDRSFFAYVATNVPHGPYHDVPEGLRKDYQQKSLGDLIVGQRKPRARESEVDRLERIAAMITNVDANVGKLLDRLKQLDVLDNTIVIFLTDNGPNTRRYVGPFRGMKSEVHEGGVRTPLWIQWPSTVPAGAVWSLPAAHIDIAPTLVDACGVEPPKDVRFDGVSLLPVLKGASSTLPSRHIAIQSHRGDRPYRYHHFMIRDSRWKLLHASGFGKERFEGPPAFELYDLQNDPGEQRNLRTERPAEFARLKAAYDRWFDDVSSTRPQNYAPPRIHLGSAHEPETVLTRQDWRNGTWERDAIGHWLVHVEEAGEYDVRLLFEPSPKGGTAELKAGGAERNAPFGAGDDALMIPKVRFEKGDSRLEAVLSDMAGKRRGVYQVIVRRRSE